MSFVDFRRKHLCVESLNYVGARVVMFNIVVMNSCYVITQEQNSDTTVHCQVWT